MIISKPIHGVIEIDEKGTIWINSVDGYCILRICKLNFENVEERFDSIDITDGKVSMTPELCSDMMSNFLNSVFEITVGKMMELPTREREGFLVDTLDKLRKTAQEVK
jgi:hypothetical protein